MHRRSRTRRQHDLRERPEDDDVTRDSACLTELVLVKLFIPFLWIHLFLNLRTFCDGVSFPLTHGSFQACLEAQDPAELYSRRIWVRYPGGLGTAGGFGAGNNIWKGVSLHASLKGVSPKSRLKLRQVRKTRAGVRRYSGSRHFKGILMTFDGFCFPAHIKGVTPETTEDVLSEPPVDSSPAFAFHVSRWWRHLETQHIFPLAMKAADNCEIVINFLAEFLLDKYFLLNFFFFLDVVKIIAVIDNICSVFTMWKVLCLHYSLNPVS